MTTTTATPTDAFESFVKALRAHHGPAVIAALAAAASGDFDPVERALRDIDETARNIEAIVARDAPDVDRVAVSDAIGDVVAR